MICGSLGHYFLVLGCRCHFYQDLSKVKRTNFFLLFIQRRKLCANVRTYLLPSTNPRHSSRLVKVKHVQRQLVVSG